VLTHPAATGRSLPQNPHRRVPLGSAPLGVCRICGRRSLPQPSMAAWSRSAARRAGRRTVQPSRCRRSAPPVRGMMADPGEVLDHRGDAVQRPQLAGEPVGRGAFQERLLNCGELLVREPGRGPGRSSAAQRACHRSARRHARGLRLGGRHRAGGRSRPGGRRRRTARRRAAGGPGAVRVLAAPQGGEDGWHAPTLTRRAAPLQLGHVNPTPKAPLVVHARLDHVAERAAVQVAAQVVHEQVHDALVLPGREGGRVRGDEHVGQGPQR
jgi:hypothetical protein